MTFVFLAAIARDVPYPVLDNPEPSAKKTVCKS